MSTQTTNYNLIKPEYTDTPDLTSMNPNWDIIDTKLKEAMESGGFTGGEVDGNIILTPESELQFETRDGNTIGLYANGDSIELYSLHGEDDLHPLHLFGLGTPHEPTEAVNKNYVDNHIDNKSNPHGVTAAQVGALPLAGGIVTGATTFNGILDVKNLGVTGGSIDIESPDKSDTLSIAYGDIGNDVLNLVRNSNNAAPKVTVGTPTSGNHAATKKYVDDNIPTKVSDLENDLEFAQIDDLAGFLSNGGGALYGDIDLVGDGSAISGVIVFNNDAEANTPYIIADFPEYDPGDNARLRLGGVWDDSEVILDGIAEPREDNHAATKGYVDNKFASVKRGTGVLLITTSPSAYTTTVNGLTPAYRVALSTVKTQAKVDNVIVGDTVQRSYYLYPVIYVDASYVYCGARVSVRGAAGTSVTIDDAIAAMEQITLTGYDIDNVEYSWVLCGRAVNN